MTLPQDPRRPDAEPAGRTVRLRKQQPADGEEPGHATMLDPSVWATPLATVEAAAPTGTVPDVAAETVREDSAGDGPPSDGLPAPGELRRFGPGVPVPADSGTGAGQAAAVWHGTVRPEGRPGAAADPRGRRRGRRVLDGWLLPLLVLLAVLAFLGWRRHQAPVHVTGVEVLSGTAHGCDSTARIVGVLRTTGGAGTVTYRWRRSDGAVSGELRQQVSGGVRQTRVTLLWTFNGHGTLRATATLEVLSPQPRTAAADFTYRCR